MNPTFWFVAGMLTGLAAAFVAVPLWRALALRPRHVRYAIAAGATIAVGIAAVIAYRHAGKPELASGTQAPAQAPDAETDPNAFKAAHAEAIATYERELLAAPNNIAGWLTLAHLYRQQRDFPAARGAFDKVIALNGMTAESWADYADVLGSLSGGSLAGEAGRAIDKALALDAKQPKALWLKASLAHEQQQYEKALAAWQVLRSQLPDDSSDARIVDANIAEATQLIQAQGKQPPVLAAAAAASPAISGTVALDPKLSGRVGADAVLFIYAKAVGSPGPPLAVMRTAARSWPVSFKLDDSSAMVPGRTLSAFDQVTVEARISNSGQATPARGDLYTVSGTLKPTAAGKLALIISQEIG